MKCIRCNHDSKYKERTNQTCPKCKKLFAFEPRDGAKLSDMAFQSAIDRVSGRGKVRWTPAHLYYEACRRLRPRALRRPSTGESIGGGVVLAIIGGVSLISRGVAAFVLFVLVLGCLVQGVRWLIGRRSTTPPLTREAFETMWQTWLRTHGKPAGLIERAPQAAPRPPRRPLEADIGDYSFDRAVICDRPETVDLLLANNFHFENNCAVLSADGYPPAPFETVRAMLKRNPRLQAFALHDATLAGCQLAHLLTHDPDWFAGQVPVIDVGLRPGQAGAFRGLWLATPQLAVVPEAGLKASEVAWLQQYSLELAAVRPDQVLKRLFRAMNRPHDDDDDGSDVYILGDGDHQRERESFVIEDEDSFSSDASADDGGADSFG